MVALGRLNCLSFAVETALNVADSLHRDKKNWLTATVLFNVPDNAVISCNEVFGPVLAESRIHSKICK